jgi:hypothetical protein
MNQDVHFFSKTLSLLVPLLLSLLPPLLLLIQISILLLILILMQSYKDNFIIVTNVSGNLKNLE